MATTWTRDDVSRFAGADELGIAVRRPDGTLRRRLPIWVVTVGDQVYVRTWYRRDTGWFAHALATRRARVSVPGLEADVTVTDAGAGPDLLRADIDAAYQAKYGRYGPGAVGPMVSPEAAATTLRLDHCPPGPAG